MRGDEGLVSEDQVRASKLFPMNEWWRRLTRKFGVPGMLNNMERKCTEYVLSDQDAYTCIE